MRPVNKWPIGTTYLTHTIQQTYNPYNQAKPYLEANIGGYCSYCERVIEDEAMHIEHIQAKSLPMYFHLKYEWNNFLVACHRCNGVDNKHNKDVVFNQTHLPHINNTHLSISYFEDGTVTVTPGLNPDETAKAQSLIDLVGLDKILGDPRHLEGDKRYERRKTAWKFAAKLKADYDKIDTFLTPVYIAEFAAIKGFWSVWMKVFNNNPEVQNELILAFNGTFPDCNITDVNRDVLP
jgi:uncharacterized protein (TIGR02646 family)